MANTSVQFSTIIACTGPLRDDLRTRLTAAHTDYPGGLCHIADDPHGLCLHADEAADLETIASVLADWQVAHPTAPRGITLSWAYTCSRPIPDEFGGGAVAIVDGQVQWFDAATLAQAAVAKALARPAKRRAQK